MTTSLTTQSELYQHHDSLKQELDLAQKSLEDEKTHKSLLGEQVEELHKMYKTLQDQNERLQQDSQRLRSSSDSAQSKADQLEKDLEAEKIAVSVLQTKLEVQESSQEGEGEEVKKLNEEIARLQERFNELRLTEERKKQEAYENWKRENEELHERIMALSSERADEKLRSDKQHGDHILSIEALFTKKISALEADVGDLKTENDSLRTDNQRLENTL